jgi:DDE superfamily endonuclease
MNRSTIQWTLNPTPQPPTREKGKQDPQFRTKLKIGVELVRRAVQVPIPFRAVVADSFYGEDRGFRKGLRDLNVGYVLALKPSHEWWHPQEEIGSFQEAARAGRWKSPEQPGQWVKIIRTFRDGSSQDCWALELDIRPFGPEKQERVIVATTDPDILPDLTTFDLITNLPAPGSQRAQESTLAVASVEEVLFLYGMRMWVEQSYKQVKHALGWSQYQVRSDQAIRRHWQLVCCAFSFCWYAQAHATTERSLTAPIQPSSSVQKEPQETLREPRAEGKKGGRNVRATTSDLAQSPTGSQSLAQTLGLASAILASVVATAPTSPAPTAP